ncbi:MAG: hypothetical protein EOP47_10050 [Sphingobacteriaceae bacterium]|nr:MAG: hypothetical protein EOP47_10050 [Sphingobacteriaceae bacterium]
MIKRSLVIFAILFALFNIAATYTQPDTSYAQSDFQRNVIKADQYIYSHHDYNPVILGSSLAYRIPTDSLPGFYNLALSGMSIYDGGAVLLSCKTIPKIVFIEINIILRPKSESFSDEFESPVYSFIKRTFPALRAENQPVILIKKSINQLKSKKNTIGSRSKKATPRNIYMPDRLFKPLLAIQVKEYSNRDTALTKQSIILLKELVQKIEAKGSKVILFEMPVNPIIQQSPKATLIRAMVAKNFPYHQFIAAPPTPFKTRDGLHLAQKEAFDYALYLRSKIQAN